MPTKYKICKHLDKLNANWNLKSTPGEAEQIQISFEESLEEQIKRLQKKWSVGQGYYTTIKVKISGDGINIGKRLKLEMSHIQF